jgi:hypothetical protein
MYCFEFRYSKFEFAECPNEKVEVYSVTYGNTSCEQI